LRPPPPENAPFQDYTPRLGRDPDINFQFNRHKITPSREGFRNLHERGLIQRIDGKLDANKALYVQVQKKDDAYGIYNVGTGQNTLSPEQYQRIFKVLSKYMEDEKDLFMHDGAVGSSRTAQFQVRVISDNAATSLWAKHMLHRVKLDDVTFQDYQAIAYASPHFNDTKVKEYGIKEDAFVAFHSTTEERPTVRASLAERINIPVDLPFQIRTVQLASIGGTDSSQVLLRTFATLSSRYHLTQPGIVPLNCDSIGKGDSTTLVFGANNIFLKKAKPTNLLGAHNHFWTEEGIVPFWRGVCYPTKDAATLTKGSSLVERLPSGEERTTVPLNSPNVFKHPKNIIFMVEDSKNSLPTLSKLSPVQAVQHLVAGYNGSNFEPFFGKHLIDGSDPKNVTDNFRAYLEKHQVSVHMINTNGQGKPMPDADLEALLKSIQDGAVAGASVGSGFSTLTPVTKLGNYHLQTNAGANATKFEQDLKEFLKSKFPTLTS